MTLLDEIQSAAVDVTVPVAVLLRKCMVLAAKLKNEDMWRWASRELNGYALDVPRDDVPPYRTLHAQAHGAFVNAAYYWKDIVIPAALLPDGMKSHGERVQLRQPVAELQGLAETDAKGSLSCPWPGDLIAHMQDKILANAQLVSAWQTVTHQQMAGILDVIRTRVLEFSLALQREAPDAGEPTGPAVPTEKVTQLIQTFITGPGANVAIASDNVKQVAVAIPPGDLDALRSKLLEFGVPSADVDALEATVVDDVPAPSDKLGPKTKTWLGTLATKVGTGTVQLAKGVSIELVVKAVSAYFGF
jgi:AbiTii